jgi:hypothetical protein
MELYEVVQMLVVHLVRAQSKTQGYPAHQGIGNCIFSQDKVWTLFPFLISARLPYKTSNLDSYTG